jgi:hypothetical protein
MAWALALAAAPAIAQQAAVVETPRAAASPAATSEARFKIRIMEGVLEGAVQHGAQNVNSQLRAVSPEVALFSGPARARGYRLDGYGVFFAVDVPGLLRSFTWTVRTLTQSNADLSRALQSIRRMVQSQDDARMKTELEQALRLVELQVGPTLPRAARTSEAASADARGRLAMEAADTQEMAQPPPVIANPHAVYTSAVQDALVDAMLEHGDSLKIGTEEWLTVAARENSDTMLAGDLTETATITLRVKGSDLEALKTGRATRDEVRGRVEVKQF